MPSVLKAPHQLKWEALQTLGTESAWSATGQSGNDQLDVQALCLGRAGQVIGQNWGLCQDLRGDCKDTAPSTEGPQGRESSDCAGVCVPGDQLTPTEPA